MYYPYFRGKQFDLITLRECAGLMAEAGFVPIVEPVKESLNGLKRSIDAINEAGGEMVLIVNPTNGEHSGNFDALNNLVQVELKDHANLSPGMLLTLETSIAEITAMIAKYPDRLVTLIHCGFASAKLLAEHLTAAGANVQHVFIDDQCGVSYTKHLLISADLQLGAVTLRSA